tara:strand:- start:1459 stop:2415 length:957 start_codon:yes stop_codon:yes gene_type:complete
LKHDNAKFFVAGHNGMVGSSILRKLQYNGYKNIITINRNDLDLTNQNNVKRFFKTNQPDYVFICAAKVGGIYANNTQRAEFIYQNLQIQNNLIHYAHENNVKKLIFLGSSCIYPTNCKQPIKEEYLLTGPLEQTNEPYAIAKIAGIKMCENYFRQYGNNYISAMPSNLYGINDNFDFKTSHVLPALIRKFHEAKISNKENVIVWGSGKPRREFLNVDDCSDAILYIFNSIDAKNIYSNKISHINIGIGEDISILNLAKLVAKIVDFEGKIIFDPTKPDGVKQKLLDISRLTSYGWEPKIDLELGIKNTYQWFIKNYYE